MSDQSGLPDLPEFNLARMLVKHLKVRYEVLNFVGYSADSHVEYVISRQIFSVLNARGVYGSATRDNLRRTCEQLRNCLLTNDVADTFAWQIVGRLPELSDGPIVLYDGVNQRQSEWIPLEIIAIKEVPWEDKTGVQFTLKCYGGHPSGFNLVHKFPTAWLNFFAYQVGFTRTTVYDGNVKHFQGLKFWAWRNLDGLFDAWRMSAEFKKANSEIIKLRTRNEYERAECPKGHALSHSCFECKEICPANIPAQKATQATSASATS